VLVGVIGGGRMGAGIAQVFATVGADVVVVESDPIAAKAARTRVETGLARAAERGKLAGTPAEVLAKVRVITEIAQLPTNSELVVEAVPEAPELKVRVLTAAELAVSTSTVIATNTSSLSIGELGAVLVHPRRFVGMHFFNPVPVSKLVEVVLGPNTSVATRDRVLEWVKLVDKSEVVVRDSPGFATSRLGVMLGLEAIRMLEEGVADAESIDRAMELGYGHPMGPLRSTDLVGLDVRLAIAEYLQRTLGDRFAPPTLLRDKVERKELGRKTGQGFYSWN
jgi:3-hydroxybutyryl-CoA dehydrogenase